MFQQKGIKIITFLDLCSNDVAKTTAFDSSVCNAFIFFIFFQANGIKIGPQHSPSNPSMPSGGGASGQSGGCC